jgi:hypothetical protein
MKKNKEWAFIELGKLFPSHAEMHDFPDNITEVKCELLNKVYDILAQLDEPEVLSQEWIDEHTYHEDEYDFYYADPDELKNLLVPKQELPVIPQFVAEFLIGKEDYMLYELFDDEWLYEEHDRVAKWLYDNDELTNKQREIDLVMARDRGCVVEEEQKYYALTKDKKTILLERWGDEPTPSTTPITEVHESDQFTEQEIKDYDPRYMAFAVPVEEIKQ